MIRILFHIVLFVIVNLSGNYLLYGQNYNYLNYTTENGLPSSEVYHVMQDSKGYLWFSTDNGVSKFDGYKFINFDVKSGLLYNTVFETYEDWKGRIWFIGLSAKLCYYENNQIKPYRYNNIISELTATRPVPVKNSFYIDSLENVFLPICDQGLIKITPQGNVTNLIKEENESLLLIKKRGERDYQVSFKNDNKSELTIKINNTVNKIKNKFSLYWSSLLFAVPGKTKSEILFTIEHSIFSFKNDSIKKLSNFNKDIIWFSKDKNGDFWLSERDHGIRNSINPEFQVENTNWFLKNKSVSSVLVDTENGIWFTTLTDGVFYLPSKEIKTLDLSAEKESNVYSVCASPKFVYLAIKNKNLSVFNKDFTKKVKQYELQPENYPLKLSYHPLLKKIICGNYRLCNIIDEKNGKVYNFSKDYLYWAKKIDPSVKCIYSGNSNYFWIGTYTGICKFDEHNLLYLSSINDNWKETVYAIYENTDQSLWIGTLNGLWKYENGEYKNLGINNKLLSVRINALYKYNNKLFIGTKGNGLILLNLSDNTLEVITEKKGLLSNSLTSIVQYNNEIWIGTNKGINRLVFQNDSIINISNLDRNSGLIDNEINQLFVDNNMLYIATRKGLNYLDLSKLAWTKTKPLLYIQHIKINNKDTLLDNHFKLDYYQNDISISYVAIAYKSRKRIIYKYKLSPLDNEWNETTATEINFSNLSPGDYIFKIKAMNENGIWSDVNKNFSFSIDKPFWNKWWFYILPIVPALLLIIIIIENILYKIRKENELRKNLKSFTKKAISSQINPHFIFNSFNSLNLTILRQNKVESSKYLSKISNYLRFVLDAVQSEFLTINDEVKIVKLYLELEKLRLKDKINYQLELSPDLDPQLNIPGLFIQPLVEKAIWTRLQLSENDSFIKIIISKKDNFLEVDIEDNGKVDSVDKLYDIRNNDPYNERIKVLNEFYKDYIRIDFYSNTKVSFTDQGNLIKIKLNLDKNKGFKFW